MNYSPHHVSVTKAVLREAQVLRPFYADDAHRVNDDIVAFLSLNKYHPSILKASGTL